MKILTFTTLYPNAAQPNHGVFVENRLRHLTASGQVAARVVAPVPWFPTRHPRFGRYAVFARVPRVEVRHGIPASHPRFVQIPKVGMTMQPFLLAAAAIPEIQRIRKEGHEFDLIDAHYFYPDGVAAAILGCYFNKPVVITARGSDISVLPQFRVQRAMIRWAAKRAAGIITVCQALKEAMLDLNLDGSHITPLRNGVDLKLFRPTDRQRARAELGLQGFTLLSVGQLITHKGHALVIEALRSMPDVRLLIAGTGPDRDSLESLARRLGVLDRVRFLSAIPHADLKRYYGAADALVLASSREGWANVLLESMACGTPVIASNVWGTPEVVSSPDAGVLMSQRNAQGIVDAVHALRTRYPDRDATRRYAERFSWDETTNGQLRLFSEILSHPTR
ncbi:glycosyltransferase family 4 protein [Noviherbaspirillum sp. UKPF54]|uniref:glycosyltransferase family 4 protein n=1 Tax=Noviherbaspirillum sp. UKPF54 TaxID=2601898 RepID=UPI0011B13FAF|nr:glycosyltransferase family 4 protein [Noviherbaspirillum sp. UKPF54]QDZ28996.1 glycosyltransferase family 4 protein [Noviherbaspirillum sp. UKPF54]